MSTPEEIKEIAREYANLNIPKGLKDDALVRSIAYNNEEMFADFLEWLSKDYAIVSKSELKEVYNCYKQHEYVTDKKGLHDAMLIARGSIAAMHDVFGKELFKEE